MLIPGFVMMMPEANAQRVPMNVIIAPIPPFSSQIGDYINNPIANFSVMIQNTSSSSYEVYLGFSLEQLTPTRKSISTPPHIPPHLPITIPAFSTYGPLSKADIDQNFGHLKFDDYILDGFDIQQLIQNLGVLEEGDYRLCVSVYNHNMKQGNPILLNLQKQGCSIFSICQSASAPSIVMPTACSNPMNDTLPPSNPLFFSWMAPITNCAMSISTFEYDISFVEVMQGQDITSALANNPPVLEFPDYTQNTLLVDSNITPAVFVAGHRYAWTVKAKVSEGSPEVTISNKGESPPCSFVYGFIPSLPPDSIPPDSIPPVEPDKPDIIHDTTPSTIAECNAPLPENKTFFSTNNLVGKRVKLGYFTMTIETASLVGESYSGYGFINWKPYTNDTIRIAVEFSGLKINSAYQVYEGIAYSRTEDDMLLYIPESIRKAKTWAEMANGYAQYVGASSYQSHIDQYTKKIGAENRKIRQLGGSAPYRLPLTIGEVAQNPWVDIGIIGMVFTPTTARMNLLAGANIPEANDFLAFVGHGFCFLPEGFGNFGEGSLFLADDFTVPMPDGFHLDFKRAQTLGDTNSGGTFIKWDDNGFDQARIECDLRFPASMLIKENSAGDIQPGQEVKATFAAHFREWGNWMAMATMDPFQIPELPGYSFTPAGIWYDNSRTVNPDNITFLPGYTGTTTSNWKGLYIEELSVKLPANFRTFNQTNQRTTFMAGNVLIDNRGFTGDISGYRLINLSTGNLGGWNFSMDTIRVEVRNSSLKSAWLNGQMLLPISDTALVYRMEMHLYQGELLYAATLHPRDTMNMSLWLARMYITPNSGFDVTMSGDYPKFSFVLNGGISMEIINTSDINLSLKGITFEDMGMSNHRNGKQGFSMSIGTWKWASPEKTLGPFPIDFSVPELIQDTIQNLFGFRFGASFDLADKAFVCTTKVDVLGEVSFSMNSGPRAQFRRVQLYDIMVSGSFSPISIEGRLQFYYDHPTYGDGVKGRVVATFPIVTVDATAQFGDIKANRGTGTPAYSYWYVDASVKFDPPIEAWPFGIGGFIGGAWYNMRCNYEQVVTPSTVYADSSRLEMVKLNPGESVSGITYTPQRGVGGIKAGVALTLSNSLGGGNVINGDVTLACQFNNGKFSSFSIEGNVWGITNYPKNDEALFNAHMLMVYDHDSSTFFFGLTAHTKIGSITATIPVEFWTKTNANQWYFKIGDPSDTARMARAVLFEMDAAVVKGYLGARAYFALGNALRDVNLPDVPQEIQDFLEVNLAKYRIDPSSFSSSNRKGMLFGAQIRGSLNIDLAIIYADFSAIAGFDVALFHDKDLLCGGQSAGYNGWYGLGQIYGYFKGDVGVKIDVWFFEGKASLGSIEAGALLMGGMPNPFWTFGKVRIRGSVLGGLIKISTSVSMEIGTPCYPGDGANPLDNIRILEQTNPGHETIADARDNPPESVFIDPRVIANVPLSGSVENIVKIDIPPSSQNSNGSEKNYIFFIKDITVYEGNSTTVPENAPAIPINWANDNNNFQIVNIARQAPLKPHTYYKIVVRATGRVSEGGVWVNPLIKNKRNEHIETLVTYFKTGALPNNIPKENLVFSMPLNRQRNFYSREYTQCAILLKDAQNYLFTNVDKRVELWVRSLDDTYARKLSYTVSGNAIYYNMPVDMPKHTLFNLALIQIDLEGEQNFLNALAQENRKQLLTSLHDGKKLELLASMGTVTVQQSNVQQVTQAIQEGTLTTTQQAGMAGGGNLVVTTPGINQAAMTPVAGGGSQGSTTPQVTSQSTIPSGTTTVTTKTNIGGTTTTGGTATKVAGVTITQGGTSFDELALANWAEIKQGYISTYKNDTSDYRKMELLNKAETGYMDTLINIYFRTSFYDRIADKFAAAGLVKATSATDFATNPYRNLDLQSANPIEAFERIELVAYEYIHQGNENPYGFYIPPLLFPNEAFDPSLNNHAVWRTKVFDMLHWIYDECERGNFKIKQTHVTAPDVLKIGFSFMRLEPVYLQAPGYRHVPSFYPQNYKNPMSFDTWLGVVQGITDAEIRNKALQGSYNSFVNYSASTMRQALQFDFDHAHAFLEDYERNARHWSDGSAKSRDRKAADCVREGWVIRSPNPNTPGLGAANYIELPYYQMVQFWEDKNAVHLKLAGRVYNNLATDYINIQMPALNYTVRDVYIQRLRIQNPTSDPNYRWHYDHSCIMKISYLP